MKKKIYFLILILAIGFAAVSTTFIMRGSTSIAVNENDYNIFFSEAILDDVNKTNVIIDDTRQVIIFDTKKLTLEGEKSVLDYEVTNNSKQYDASVKINCMVQDERILEFIDLKYSLDKDIILAGTKANGKIEVELAKAFADDMEIDNELTCSIETTAIERTSLVEEGAKLKTYYAYGFLVDEFNHPVKNSVVTAYGKEPHSTTTDDRGMFIIEGITGGEYTLYVNNNLSLEEVNSKTKEELDSLSNQKTNFETKAASLTFENNYLRYGKVIVGDPVVHNITFDTNGGVNPTFTSKTIEGQEIGFLPSQTHNSLIYANWQVSGIDINENTIINEDTTLLASYVEGIVKVDDKHFTDLNEAFDYAEANNKHTIVALQDTGLSANVTNTKDLDFNLNGKNINFKDYSLSNLGTMTLRNGNIKASGLNVLTNNNILNLSENINIEHINSTNEQDYISTITNQAPATLNISDANITTDYSSYVEDQATIKNEGNATITNSNFNLQNAYLIDKENATMTLNNSNFDFSSDISDNHMIQDSGILTINDGTFQITEDNEKSNGLITVQKNSTLNINSGVFDNTYGKGIAFYTYTNTTFNLGSKDKIINVTGNKANVYTVYTLGNVNIFDGTINASNGYFFYCGGKTIIGTESTAPTINGPTGYTNLTYSAGKDHKIVNGNINGKNSTVMDIQNEGTKVTIDNINLHQSNSTYLNRSIIVSNAELVVNDGTFKIDEDNEKGYGILEAQNSGTITVNGGTFDSTYGKSNAVYTQSQATLNIGCQGKTVNFIGNNSTSYTVYTLGNINIFDGTINGTNGHFIGINGKMIIGTENTAPTINGPTGYKTLIYKAGKDHKIVSGNISGKNNIIVDIQSANVKLTIDDVNLTQSNSTSTSRLINISDGELIINDGTFKIAEDNAKSDGLITAKGTAKLTINAGTFDNTYGKKGLISSTATVILNLGSKDKKVFLKNGATGYFTGSLAGETNILDGELEISGLGLSLGGKTTIGSSTTIPIIKTSSFLIDTVSTTETITIENANVNCGTYVARTHEGSNLIIKNGTYSAISENAKLFRNDANSTLTIENGQFTSSKILFQISGTTNINGGNFISTTSTNNAIGISTTGILNIGADVKNTISITNLVDQDYPVITNDGILNIYNGTIKTINSNTIIQTLTSSGTISTEDKLNYAATINIYGGRIENNSTLPTIYMNAGHLNMSGGEVINSGGEGTICNDGGTAIQTGGTSLKNYNVTVQ